MKIFVFEFITGGGLSDQPLPENLVTEGRLMLRALVKDLLLLRGIELYVTQDSRLQESFILEFKNINLTRVSKSSDLKNIFIDLCEQCDAVWPIAPESGGILAEYCEMVEASSTRLLNSTAETVKKTGNKLLTFQCLRNNNIPVISTSSLSGYHWLENHSCVIKPIDGVGCENTSLVTNNAEFEQVKSKISNPSEYLIQPFLEGRSISLSCLFKNQRAFLICCNEQKMSIENRRFSLSACIINIDFVKKAECYEIINNIANAVPGLWGYVGIDLIATPERAVILEINPRLTTSYAGINPALGINVAENVLQMIDGEPLIKPIRHQQETVSVL